MSEGALVGSAVAPTTGPAAPGLETRELTFDEGWDRQDRWLRFVDPALERDYREAMTPAARRRFRLAAAVGGVSMALQPIQVPALGLGSLGPTIVTAIIVIAALSAAVAWSGRVGLRGLWGLACGASAVYAMGIAAIGVEGGKFLLITGFGLAVLGIIQIA